jgi:(p)ppGpp synthase/HD superfamily hydrolase
MEQHAEDGRTIVERELRRLGKRGFSLDKLNEYFHRAKNNDLYVAVGKNEITAGCRATGNAPRTIQPGRWGDRSGCGQFVDAVCQVLQSGAVR